MRNILKVKDWLDKKRSVDSFMFDWAKKAKTQGLINTEDLDAVVDPKTGEIKITLKFKPIIYSEDYFIGSRG